MIPSYNYGRFVARAVESVLAQTYPSVQVIVVDDGSTDDTVAVLARFGDRIQVIRQPNAGVTAARNAGALASDGSLLAFLDADDYWHEEKLSGQVAAYLDRPDVGLVHSGVQEVDHEGRVLGSGKDGLGGWVAEELLLFRRTVIVGSPSNALIPRAVFDEVGGFDPALSTAGDWDLCFRIAARYPFVYVRETTVSYTLHSANMHRNIDVMERDMRFAFRKAFAAEAGASYRHLRREAYSNLYVVLSGSYFVTGHTAKAVWSGVRGCLLRPQAALRLTRASARTLGRRGSGS